VRSSTATLTSHHSDIRFVGVPAASAHEMYEWRVQ
jgi:hypothetical protein